MNVLYIPEALEQNVVDRQRSIFPSDTPKQHNAVFLWHKSTQPNTALRFESIHFYHIIT